MDLCILYRIRFAVKRVPLLALLALIVPFRVWSQADPLPWMNGIRRAAGVAPLAADALLSRTAREWAGMLARAGVVSHRGSDGSTALDRYRSLGGTEVRVGEIIGAGPRLGDVEKGWMRSGEHRSLVLRPQWTHAGWGRKASQGSEVWVVLFCQKVVEDLLIHAGTSGLSISGRFGPPEAARAILFAGLEEFPPTSWDPGTRHFGFLVSDPSRAGYLRLGYESPEGAFRLTNSFTWPPEMESRGAPSRFSEPAASP
jgi:hypothetical protein